MNINLDSCSYCIQKQNKPNMEIRPRVLFIYFLSWMKGTVSIFNVFHVIRTQSTNKET